MTVTFKMQLFVNVFESIHSLTILRKSSLLDFAGVLHRTLITDIFASHNWMLINLKPISLSYRNWWVNSNSEDGSLL